MMVDLSTKLWICHFWTWWLSLFQIGQKIKKKLYLASAACLLMVEIN